MFIIKFRSFSNKCPRITCLIISFKAAKGRGHDIKPGFRSRSRLFGPAPTPVSVPAPASILASMVHNLF